MVIYGAIKIFDFFCGVAPTLKSKVDTWSSYTKPADGNRDGADLPGGLGEMPQRLNRKIYCRLMTDQPSNLDNKCLVSEENIYPKSTYILS